MRSLSLEKPSESSEKISEVWNEHRSDLTVRRALEVLLSRLGGQTQAKETRSG